MGCEKVKDDTSGWIEITEGVPEGGLISVYFTSESVGYAVGEEGVIIKTEDGGFTWESQSSGTTSFLRGIHFVNSTTGFAVGLGGTILKTTNGGQTWTNSSLPGFPGYNFTSVFFTDVNNGYAVGSVYTGGDWHGFIVNTSNGGASWSELMLSTSTAHSLTSVFFTSASVGYAVGNAHNYPVYSSVVMKTVNGGISWSPMSLLIAPSLYDIFFTSPTTGYAVGTDGDEHWYGGIIKTTDSGATWTRIDLPYTSYGYTLWSVHFPDANTGYAVGTGGTIFKTKDGGNTWIDLSKNLLKIDDSYGLRDFAGVFFTNAVNGIVVGYNYGKILKTEGQ